MKDSYQEISRFLKVYQQTIRNFCNDFEINFNNQFIGIGHVSHSIFNSEFINFLKLNKEFISKYESDNYEEKTVIIIAEKINRPIKEIEDYLRKNYANSYENGNFKLGKINCLRYISSYAIDYNLGGNYNFLKFDA